MVTAWRTPQLSRSWFAAVLLDLDGTLVDSRFAINRAWKTWCDVYDVSFTHIADLMHGRTAFEVIKAVRPRWSAAKVAEAAGLQLRIQELDPRPGEAMAGAKALLNRLEKGHPRHPWAVVTACSAQLARHRLSAGGLPTPSVLISVDDVTAGKPSPEPYLRAAEQLGVDAAECLVVEDAPAGVAAGLAAGCHVVAVTTTHDQSALGRASAIVDDLTLLDFDEAAPTP